MASLVQRPAIQTWLEPRALPRSKASEALARSTAVKQAQSIWVFDQIVAIAIAIPAMVISCGVQFFRYAGAVLLFPFLPFLAPLFAAPVVLLLSGTVLAFGGFLTAIGWL
jgi:hypothetical protein